MKLNDFHFLKYYGVDKEFTGRYWSKVVCGRDSFSRDELIASLNHPLIGSVSDVNSQEILEPDYSSAVHHEAMAFGPQLKTVQIENLRKNFGDTEVLTGVSVSMYEKQIFWYDHLLSFIEETNNIYHL